MHKVFQKQVERLTKLGGRGFGSGSNKVSPGPHIVPKEKVCPFAKSKFAHIAHRSKGVHRRFGLSTSTWPKHKVSPGPHIVPKEKVFPFAKSTLGHIGHRSRSVHRRFGLATSTLAKKCLKHLLKCLLQRGERFPFTLSQDLKSWRSMQKVFQKRVKTPTKLGGRQNWMNSV